MQETITIVVNEKGARVVKRNLEDIGNSAESSSKGVDLLKRALAGLAAVVGLNALKNYASAWTDIKARIGLAVGDMSKAEQTMDRLGLMARRTYSDFTLTAEGFLANSQSLKELGYNTQQTLDYVEAMNNALVVSGAKAERAATVQNALSKAMASGKLNGQNLNTVIEQGGRITQALASTLGVTTNQLRKLGSEGKITSQVIYKALAGSLEQLRAEADAMPATINDAIVLLGNSFFAFIGRMNEATGAGAALAQGIIKIADNIGLLAQVLGVAAAAWAGYWLSVNFGAMASVVAAIMANVKAFIQLAASVRSVSGAMLLLNATLMTNPFVLLGTVIVGIIGSIVIFRKEIAELLRSVTFFGTNAMEMFATIADVIVGTWGGIKNVLRGFFDWLRVELFKLGDTINRMFGKELIPLDSIISNDVVNVVRRAGQSMGENFQEGFDSAVEDGFLVRELSRDFSPRKGVGPLESSNVMSAAPAGIDEESLKRQKQLLEAIKGPARDFKFAVKDLQDLYSAGKITLQEYTNELQKQELQFLNTLQASSFSEGFVNQIRKMQLETRNATAQMGEDFAKIFGPGGSLEEGISKGISDAVTYGKKWSDVLRDVARQILSQVIPALMKAVMLQSSASGSKSSGGGIFGTILSSVLGSFGGGPSYANTGFGNTTVNALKGAAGYYGPGFSSGGYTGNIGQNQIAGTVHGQEFVMNAAATRRNLPALQAMNSGRSVSSGSLSLTVEINNEIPNASYEVNQIDENRVEVIARRVVAEDAPSIIAGDLSSANSKTSKAISKYTQTGRKRN